jgi:hypothetical protein
MGRFERYAAAEPTWQEHVQREEEHESRAESRRQRLETEWEYRLDIGLAGRGQAEGNGLVGKIAHPGQYAGECADAIFQAVVEGTVANAAAGNDRKDRAALELDPRGEVEDGNGFAPAALDSQALKVSDWNDQLSNEGAHGHTVAAFIEEVA